MKNEPRDIARLLTGFTGASLTRTLSEIEDAARGISKEGYWAFLEHTRADKETLAAAAELKRIAG